MPPNTKGRRFPVELITPREFDAILQNISRTSISGKRNRALFTLLYRTGLRLQEALDLRPADIDTSANLVNVRAGKGLKQRFAGIDDHTLVLIEFFRSARRTTPAEESHPLFCAISEGTVGNTLDQSYVRRALRHAAVRANISKRVHPHALRHSFASQLAAEGVPINVISRQLGHASVATTDRYLNHIAPHDLAAIIVTRQVHPPQ